MSVNMALRMAAAMASGQASDPYWTSVTLLLHGDGANNGTTFTDSKGLHTQTRSGSAVTSTTSPKFGTASIYLADQSTDQVNIGTPGTDFQFAGDFTVECWAKYVSGGEGSLIIVSDGSTYFGVNMSSTTLGIYLNNGTPNFSCGTVTGAWQHIAFVRYGSAVGNILVYVDGTQVAPGAAQNTNTLGYSSPSSCRLGGGLAGAKYIDDLRVTKGVARYTANFTPPTAAFPNA